MRESQIKALVLYADYTTRLSYYNDWFDAFKESSEFDVTALNVCQRRTRGLLKKTIGQYESIVLLHSTNGDTLEYIEPYKQLLQDRRGNLLTFVGNEVNLPGSPIADKRRFFGEIRPDHIATQLPLEAGEYLFGDCAQRRVVAIPHALNPTAFTPGGSDSQRRVDIGVRSAHYPAYLGDNDRGRLIDYFSHRSFDPPLVIDINTQERLNRADWAKFLASCRGTIATEAGSWYLERDDQTVDAIRSWAMQRARTGGLVIPADSFARTIGHKLPWSIRALLRRLLSKGPVRHELSVHEKLDFSDVHHRFFKDRARPNFYGKCISSRHFDAIGTKTCQIMIKGRFNDILEPDEHYISLEPDFSNLDVAVSKFRDPDFRSAMVEHAYEFALSAHTYQHRVNQVASILDS